MKFNRIHYSQCWEDCDLLLEALNPKSSDTIISIISGGENTLALASSGASRVIAVDYNIYQTFLLEIKMQSFKQLSYEEMLGFLGIHKNNERGKLYLKVREQLSISARKYWDSQPKLINQGIIHCGKMENYFSHFRKILYYIHSSQTINEMINVVNTPEARNYYNEKWNNFRWRIFFRLFFSKTVLAWLGRKPEFFRYVKDDVVTAIENRILKGISRVGKLPNIYLHYILKGCFGDDLPYSYRPENFILIKENINKIEIRHCTLKEALLALPNNSLNLAALSNIFEYLSISEETELKKLLGCKIVEQGIMIYWNFLVKRDVASEFFRLKHSNDTFVSVADRIIFYEKFFLEERI